ncbi:XRE family transcriptional regulator [Clostridium baratii]|uniref:XRE family transcriptional regulator n=1 Tax=Clostridium baratii TaxID=1561 RepID=UPI0030D60EA4
MNNNISENLYLLRKKFNLSQSDLANKLNISRQALSNYENGTRTPTIDLIIEIAKIFNCSLDELVNNQNNLSNEKISDLLNINFLNFSKKDLLKNLKNKKKYILQYQKEIPKKIKEIDDLIEFLENKESDISKKVNDQKTNTKNLNKELEKNKKDTEIGEEICIDFETKKQEKTKKEYVKIPVYNLSISAGTPLFSENSVVDELRNLKLKKPLTKNNLEEFFILKVDGDSMNNIVDDGEEILVRGTNYVNNGEIAVVTLLKDSVASTLKHYYRIGDEVLLKPNSSNPKHHIQKYNLDEEDVLVQGKYIGKVKDFL